MLGITSNDKVLASGAKVGTDLSGSGNDLIVNAGDRVTFHAGPLPGSRRVPALRGFPYVSATAARAGMGCAFAGGPIRAWTILIALSPGDQAASGRFDEQAVFNVRPATGNAVTFALKYGNMGYTWDGATFNNLYWNPQPFATAAGTPVPTVIGWSSKGGARQSVPSMIAGSLGVALAGPGSPESETVSPPAIAGIDLPNGYAVCGLMVYATSLTPQQMKAAALRLAYVGYGGTR
jgi:hypothetical protein